jgi:hypothetical protein
LLIESDRNNKIDIINDWSREIQIYIIRLRNII